MEPLYTILRKDSERGEIRAPRTRCFFFVCFLEQERERKGSRKLPQIYLYSATLNPYPKTTVFEHDSRTSEYNF